MACFARWFTQLVFRHWPSLAAHISTCLDLFNANILPLTHVIAPPDDIVILEQSGSIDQMMLPFHVTSSMISKTISRPQG